MSRSIDDIIRKGMGESYLSKTNLPTNKKLYPYSESLMLHNKTIETINKIDTERASALDNIINNVFGGLFKKKTPEVKEMLKQLKNDKDAIKMADERFVNSLFTTKKKALSLLTTGGITVGGMYISFSLFDKGFKNILDLELGTYSKESLKKAINGTLQTFGGHVAGTIAGIASVIFLDRLFRKSRKTIDKKEVYEAIMENLEVLSVFKEKYSNLLENENFRKHVPKKTLDEIYGYIKYIDEAKISFEALREQYEKELENEAKAESFMSDTKATLASWFGYGSKEELKARYEEMERDVRTTKILKNAYLEETLTTSKKISDIALNWLKTVATGITATNSHANSSHVTGMIFSMANVFFFIKFIKSILRTKKTIPGRLEEIEKVFTDLKEKYDTTIAQLRSEGKPIPRQVLQIRNELKNMLAEVNREKIDRNPSQVLTYSESKSSSTKKKKVTISLKDIDCYENGKSVERPEWVKLVKKVLKEKESLINTHAYKYKEIIDDPEYYKEHPEFSNMYVEKEYEYGLVLHILFEIEKGEEHAWDVMIRLKDGAINSTICNGYAEF